MRSLLTKVQRFIREEDGPTAVEYAVMLAMILLIAISSINAFGRNATSCFNDISTELDNMQ